MATLWAGKVNFCQFASSSGVNDLLFFVTAMVGFLSVNGIDVVSIQVCRCSGHVVRVILQTFLVLSNLLFSQ